MSGAAMVTLAMVRCAGCGRIDTPIRAVCAGCLSDQLMPFEVAGRGVVVSFTTIRRAPTRFRDQAPYDIVVVDLADGPRITGRLAGTSAPPAIGARVQAVSAQGADTIFIISEAP